jgi:6-phosphogluconate dehydrogenase (decarboxylating)
MPKLLKSKTLLIVAVVLVLLIVGFTFFGCACKRHFFREGFEDVKTETEEVSSKDMTEKEKELFENLKENKLSDVEINKLVKAGVLTDQLVEKFLEKLQKDETIVEGFTSVGPKFSCSKF